MITKGIVEQALDKFHFKIRIPIFDRISVSSLSTSTSNLNESLVCTLPNCDPNIQPGDVVFIGFEDNDYSRPVILGYLYRNSMTKTYCDLILNCLTVNLDVSLPQNTRIGDVSSSSIQCLQGVKENIQDRFDFLSHQISLLKDEVSQLKK